MKLPFWTLHVYWRDKKPFVWFFFLLMNNVQFICLIMRVVMARGACRDVDSIHGRWTKKKRVEPRNFIRRGTFTYCWVVVIYSPVVALSSISHTHSRAQTYTNTHRHSQVNQWLTTLDLFFLSQLSTLCLHQINNSVLLFFRLKYGLVFVLCVCMCVRERACTWHQGGCLRNNNSYCHSAPTQVNRS